MILKSLAIIIVISIFATAMLISGNNAEKQTDNTNMPETEMKYKVNKSEEEWKEKLTPEQYRVLREKGTERAFSGKFFDHKEAGVYSCAACGAELFASDTKFNSGCGWPSYFKPLLEGNVIETNDTSHGMIRVEITCADCGSHLGHVFDDGPKPTGLRYCINSASLEFVPKDITTE